MLKRTFFYRLINEKQYLLFAICLLYVIGQYYYIKEQKDNLPFPLWAMYSVPQSQAPGIIYYKIICDGEELKYRNDLRDFEKERIISPLDYFSIIKENNYTDPNCREIKEEYEHTFPEKFMKKLLWKICNDYWAVEAFPEYLRRTIQSITGKEITAMQVVKEYYHYSEAGLLVLDDRYTLIDIK